MKIFTKVLAVLALAMLVAAPLSAQKKSSKSKAKASKMYIGGSFGLSYSSSNDGNGNGDNSISKGVSYRLMPEFGYNINSKLSVGGQLGILKGVAAFGSLDPSDIKSIGLAAASAALDIASDENSMMPTRIIGFRLGPYVRLTLFSTKMVDLFVDGCLAYTSAKMQSYDWNDDGSARVWTGTDYNLIEIAARPGFLVKFNDKFSVIGRLGSVGMQSAKRANSTQGITRFGVDMDSNNILLGFVYNL